MHWRKAVNDTLQRTTGYRLESTRRSQPQPPPPKRRRGPKPFRRYYDEEVRATITAVKPWTMTSHERIFGLIVAVRHLVEHDIRGDVVECGVWRGGSMQAVARILLARGITDRDLHLFDTFEGMPPPGEEDRRLAGPSAREMLETSPRSGIVWAIAGLEDVQAGMASTGYPAERVHYHPGRVEDTIPAHAPEQIALLRLDTDWYESTKHELEHLYDRVVEGGVIIIDDYDYWEGSRKAVDEFLAATGARVLLVPVDTARIATKP
jgi:O-methyltransferase